jgi:hypothetical protein
MPVAGKAMEQSALMAAQDVMRMRHLIDAAVCSSDDKYVTRVVREIGVARQHLEKLRPNIELLMAASPETIVPIEALHLQPPPTPNFGDMPKKYEDYQQSQIKMHEDGEKQRLAAMVEKEKADNDRQNAYAEALAAGDAVVEARWGSVALSLCTTAHPLHTRFAKLIGTSLSEARMQPGSMARAESESVDSKSQEVMVEKEGGGWQGC